MDAQEFFAQLPRGKEDKPLLFGFGPLEYNKDDIDGLYYMLDRDFSGCLLLNFAKPMNPEIQGRAWLNGEMLPPCVLKYMPIMGNLWVLGIPMRGFVNEYGKEYSLHVEGYTDTDGNEMNPQDFTVKCTDRAFPEKKNAAHETIALQAAQEGIVLLKNEGQLLPLAEGTTLNLFGKGVNQFRTSAVGAGKINPRYTIDLLTALREGGVFGVNEELPKFYRCDRDAIPQAEVIKAAREKSDLAVMLITRGTGENLDNSSAKGEYYLSGDEENLLKTLSETFSHTVVILNTGYPIDVTFADRYHVDALIYNGFGGMLAGQALADVLSGKMNPCGKLPDTWPMDYFDLPASRNFYDSADKPRLDADCGVYADTCYEEGIYVGYRYFSTFGKAPAYPFGYGLSYTSFTMKPGKLVYDRGIYGEITVTNTGSCSGKEVVQIYVNKPDGRMETPDRELIYFAKTRELQPGETERIPVSVPEKNLTVYDTDKAAYIMPAGEYTIFAGTDVYAPIWGSFVNEAETIVKQASHLMMAPNPPETLSKRNPESWPKGERTRVKEGTDGFFPVGKRSAYPASFNSGKSGKKLVYQDVKRDPSLVNKFVAALSIEELARLCVCASAGWGMEGVGEAGRVYQLEGYDMPDFPVSDGNSGVNLRVPNIGMPSGVTLCATFNKELMEQVGRVIGEEAKALGMPLILAPVMNLHRNPLNGRQPEYFSEDPYLAGMMGGHYCKGMESAGVGSCIKHLIGNNCESTRKRNQSIIGERALRELYLKPFEIAMGEHMPASVMTAYNAVNGCPTAADEELIQGFLREENGFDGFVMTDWGTYDTAGVAEMVQAGNCWITPGSLDDTYTGQIVEGVKEGRITLERLEENAAWIIRTMIRFA